MNGDEREQQPTEGPEGGDRTSAAISLVCATLGILGCPLLAVVGIVFGHLARAQVRLRPEPCPGAWMATAGLVLGYVGLVLTVTGVVTFSLFPSLGIL